MSRGIVYTMTTIIPGMVKIGRTQTTQYETRMSTLEHNGYRNITGLRRAFAIEVENYEDKEVLMHTIFAQNRVGDTELFAVDLHLVIQLLSALEGKVIYPIIEEKETIFEEAAEVRKSCLIPDGVYHVDLFNRKGNKQIKAQARVENSNWTLLKGSILGAAEGKALTSSLRAQRATLVTDDDDVLLQDVELGECAPSRSLSLVVGYTSSDGWNFWKNDKDESLNIYRK